MRQNPVMLVSADSLAAFAQNVKLPMGLVLDEVEVKAAGISFDGDASLLEPAQVIARISPESLTTFVAAQLPPIVQRVEIGFKEGLIVARVVVKLVVEVTATARLLPEIQDKKSLTLKLVDFEGPAIARGFLEKQIADRNPVFESASVPFPLDLDDVQVNESLEIYAHANLPVLKG
ncbi:MAG: hypothetical protein JNK63_07510 [Chthonomonas sp.]|nr:hypothetical protein [Chthonomonas sp.]